MTAPSLTIDPRRGGGLPYALWVWLAFVGPGLAGAPLPGDRVPVAPDEGVSVEIIRAERQERRVEVTLDVEVIDGERARLVGYRSMQSVADIDCDKRADQVRQTEMFDQPGLEGANHARPARAGWALPTPGAYMASVIRVACDGPSGPPPTPSPHAHRPDPRPPLHLRGRDGDAGSQYPLGAKMRREEKP